MESRECGICLDRLLTKGKIDSCDHDFHFRCIQKWSRLSNKCPTCRVSFTEIAHQKNGKVVKRVKVSEDVGLFADAPSESSDDFIAECFICGNGSLEYLIACEGYFGCENVAHSYCLTRKEASHWVCDECAMDDSEDFQSSTSEEAVFDNRISLTSSESEDVILISSDSESDIIEIEQNDSVKIVRQSKQLPLKIHKPRAKNTFSLSVVELPVKRRESFL